MKYRIRVGGIGAIEIDENGRASGSPPELVALACGILKDRGALSYMAEPWLVAVEEIARSLGATVERIGKLPPEDTDDELQVY